MAGRRTDTRARIEEVALELFVEQGYEGTSLREIAARLEVTKAALYYHFRTKEDIVAALLADWATALDGLLGVGAEPAELLSRYAELVESRFGPVIGLLQHNIPALKEIGTGVGERMTALYTQLCEGREDAETRLRARLALVAVQMNSVQDATPPDVALKVALDILSPDRNLISTAT
jgi:AcrR family transcriptional regulator